MSAPSAYPSSFIRIIPWALVLFGVMLVLMELFENQWRFWSWFELTPMLLLVPVILLALTRRAFWGWVLLVGFILQQIYRLMYHPMTGMFFVVFFSWIFYRGLKILHRHQKNLKAASPETGKI